MTLNAALWIVGGALGSSAVILIGVTLSTARLSPVSVVRKLRESGSYTVRVTGSGGVWNPGGQPGNSRIIGPGTATYRLEETEAGEVVHLDFTEPSGQTRHLVGSVSDRLGHITGPSGRTRWPYAPLAIVLAQIGVGALGAVVGLVVAAGRSEHAKVVGLFVGLGCALLATWAGALVFAVAVAVRQSRGVAKG